MEVAMNVKVMEIQTGADPAVLWLRADQLCYLGGHALQSGEIVGILQKLKDDMPADLADSLKADKEDRKTDHAPLVAVMENEEVATLTATMETNLRQGDLENRADGIKGDLTETETESNEASSKWAEERQKSRAYELRSRSLLRRSSPQSLTRFLWPCDSTDGCAQRRGCGWLAKAKATARVDVPTAPRLCCVFFWVGEGSFDVGSLPVVETQKSRRNVSGVDRRETGLFFAGKERHHCLGPWPL